MNLIIPDIINKYTETSIVTGTHYVHSYNWYARSLLPRWGSGSRDTTGGWLTLPVKQTWPHKYEQKCGFM